METTLLGAQTKGDIGLPQRRKHMKNHLFSTAKLTQITRNSIL